MANILAPYAIIDSNKVLQDSLSFMSQAKFSNLSKGTYYMVLKHRNNLETWSKKGGVSYNEGMVVDYNFTDDSSKAYGDNMNKLGGKWCIYSGDVNQDGIIDLSDVSQTDIDNLNFVSGYIVTDVNGDNILISQTYRLWTSTT